MKQKNAQLNNSLYAIKSSHICKFTMNILVHVLSSIQDLPSWQYNMTICTFVGI